MLVIHPKDQTTAMLSVLYSAQATRVIETDCSANQMGHLLHHTSKLERIMLLGHGSDQGLFYRQNGSEEGFDRIIVGHAHAYHLRKHGSNLIGIWCYADHFARKEGLHGLFSGMIISDVKEAAEHGITIQQSSIDQTNIRLFNRLRNLLDNETPFRDIPQLLESMDDEHTHLSTFNYRNFFCL